MCVSQCVPLPGWAPVSVGAGVCMGVWGVHLHMCRHRRQLLHTSPARSCGSSWQGCCLRPLALLPCPPTERSAPFKPAALLAAPHSEACSCHGNQSRSVSVCHWSLVRAAVGHSPHGEAGQGERGVRGLCLLSSQAHGPLRGLYTWGRAHCQTTGSKQWPGLFHT